MPAPKRILVVCPYPQGTAAGQRLKYEQYIDDWRANGFEVDIAPFMDPATWAVVYKKGHTLQKVLGTLKGTLRRVRDLARVRQYDVLYVFMYVTPVGSSLFERAFLGLAKKVVFDLEDNRFLGAAKEARQFFNLLRSTGKTEVLVRKAAHVITSSPALNSYCETVNRPGHCTYITSSIDTDRFVPAGRYSNDATPVIGWTGTFSTRPYLDLLRPVFLRLKQHRDFKLLVIGDFAYEFKEMGLEVIRWTAANEVADLQKIDIGVYPLPIDDWAMGKSGLKAIQYMAFGLPAVCTDISTVQQFIRHGENGFLVKQEDEWVTTLTTLIDNPSLRKRVGMAARQTAMERFSKQVVKTQYRNVLAQVAGLP